MERSPKCLWVVGPSPHYIVRTGGAELLRTLGVDVVVIYDHVLGIYDGLS